MTKTQIVEALKYYGYTDLSNPLTLQNIPIIELDQDNRLYTDYKHYRYVIDTTSEIIEIYDGRTKGNTFIYNSSGTSTKPVKPNYQIKFDTVCSFLQTPKITEVGQVMYRM